MQQNILGTIAIRFMKADPTGADDVAVLRPAGFNKVDLEFTGPTTTVARCVHGSLSLSSHECFSWLDRAMRILSTDDYPIKYVQFDFAFCPSVIYYLENVAQHYQEICDMVGFHLDAWNSQYRPSVSPIAVPSISHIAVPPISIPPPPPLEEIFIDDDDALNTAFLKEDEGAAAGRHYHQQQKGRHHLFFNN